MLMAMPFGVEILLALAPALLLLVALLAGRYPAHGTIMRLAARAARSPRDRAPASIAPPRRAPRALLRNGELIARSLATRPPPAAHTAI